MSDSDFRVLLNNKDVYELLEGSGRCDLVTYNGRYYGMPYLTGNDLADYCEQVGVEQTDLTGFTRWAYVEMLIKYGIAHDCCNSILNFFFKLEHFTGLRDTLSSLDEIEVVHRQIVTAAINEINHLIILTRHELYISDGCFYIREFGNETQITTPQFDKFSIDYVAGLRKRCREDFLNGNYDSVITKSRTLLEETLVHIIEEAQKTGLFNEEPAESGKLSELYKQVKRIRNMIQASDNDKRINELLGGLEKIVNSIAAMRNKAGDAHGLGQKRIRVNEKEARLVMNASMALCEYFISEKKR